MFEELIGGLQGLKGTKRARNKAEGKQTGRELGLSAEITSQYFIAGSLKQQQKKTTLDVTSKGFSGIGREVSFLDY